MAKKETVLIWLDYTKKGMERKLNTEPNPLIKQIIAGELNELNNYINEVRNTK